MDEINLEQIKPAKGKIIIIDRRPCISHPRNKGIGNNNSTLKENLTTNFDTLKEDIIEKVNNVTSVHIIQLEKYTFLQQIYIYITFGSYYYWFPRCGVNAYNVSGTKNKKQKTQ